MNNEFIVSICTLAVSFVGVILWLISLVRSGKKERVAKREARKFALEQERKDKELFEKFKAELRKSGK